MLFDTIINMSRVSKRFYIRKHEQLPYLSYATLTFITVSETLEPHLMAFSQYPWYKW